MLLTCEGPEWNIKLQREAARMANHLWPKAEGRLSDLR